MSTVSKIIEALDSKEQINEGWDDKGTFIGRTQYFDAYNCGDEVRLSDLNGNYTMLDKQELNQFIKMLQKCAKELK